MHWRKHDDSSFARDVWTYDAATGRHTRLDRSSAPTTGSRCGAPTRRRSTTSPSAAGASTSGVSTWPGPGQPEQITRHATHPVRFLSISRQGDLCYTWDG